MSARGTIAPALRIPDVSYGPLRLLEAVPWLMLAATFRTFMSVAGMIAASVCLLLAFLLAARRMIEFADGDSGLGRFDFGEQLRLARRILVQVFALLVAGSFAAWSLGAGEQAFRLLLGFDGIAFDQAGPIGMAWSSVLAALVLIMVVDAGRGRPVDLVAAAAELVRRRRWLIVAIVVTTILQIVLSFVQGRVRWPLLLWWKDSENPQVFKNLVYFFFIFAFASVRLWATLAVFVFALRESYRHGEQA